MTLDRYALHVITDADAPGFAPDDYSYFKYGDDAVARRFGEALARGFIRDRLDGRYDGTQLVVLSSPYSFIPTATFALKRHFVRVLNRWLAERELPVVQESKIHRTVTYKEDYGALSAAERLRLISGDRFQLDSPFLRDKQLIFLDDIRITGSHERMILRTATEYALTNRAFLLYFAELADDRVDPTYENFLNYHAIREPEDLFPLLRSDRFVINTRVTKFVLNVPPAVFRSFIGRCTAAFRAELYDQAIGNGYHTLPAYAVNLRWLRQYYLTPETTHLHGH